MYRSLTRQNRRVPRRRKLTNIRDPIDITVAVRPGSTETTVVTLCEACPKTVYIKLTDEAVRWLAGYIRKELLDAYSVQDPETMTDAVESEEQVACFQLL